MELNTKLNHLRQLNIRKAIWLLIAAYLLCILAHGIYSYWLFDFQSSYNHPEENFEIVDMSKDSAFMVTNHNDFPAFVYFEAEISNTTLAGNIYFDYLIQPHQTIMLENPKDIQEYSSYCKHSPYNLFTDSYSLEEFEKLTVPAINSGNCRFDSIEAIAVTLKDFETTLYIEFSWFVLLLYVVAFGVSWAVSNTKKQIAFDVVVGVPICLFIVTHFIRMFAGAHIGFTVFNINLY